MVNSCDRIFFNLHLTVIVTDKFDRITEMGAQW